MYDIFTHMKTKKINHSWIGKYTIHGWYGYNPQLNPMNISKFILTNSKLYFPASYLLVYQRVSIMGSFWGYPPKCHPFQGNSLTFRGEFQHWTFNAALPLPLNEVLWFLPKDEAWLTMGCFSLCDLEFLGSSILPETNSGFFFPPEPRKKKNLVGWVI